MQTLVNSYSIDICFEEIKLPPFQEVLVLGKNSLHGKIEIIKSLALLAPDQFEMYEIEHSLVEAVFINKSILKKIKKEVVIETLNQRVFHHISEGELLKVDFKITITYNSIEGSIIS